MEDNEAKEASMSSIDNSSMEDKEAMEASKTFNQEDLFKALEVVERDSLAIAESYTSLFASLRLALSEITNTSVDHIQCFSDAAGKVQESAIDAATRGNRFIHSCIRLNDEMKGIDDLAAHLYPC
uniref:BLOC-1-related complex subunit 6 C-terminal helix domain-containing protein n=1 Tax=Chenopodium quinoa TaxID=63459 RepID=A0A803M3K0_CHEQI